LISHIPSPKLDTSPAVPQDWVVTGLPKS